MVGNERLCPIIIALFMLRNCIHLAFMSGHSRSLFLHFQPTVRVSLSFLLFFIFFFFFCCLLICLLITGNYIWKMAKCPQGIENEKLKFQATFTWQPKSNLSTEASGVPFCALHTFRGHNLAVLFYFI